MQPKLSDPRHAATVPLTPPLARRAEDFQRQVLVLPAGRTNKKGDPLAAVFVVEKTDQALRVRVTPIKPIRPEPSSHTAAGTGTADGV